MNLRIDVQNGASPRLRSLAHDLPLHRRQLVETILRNTLRQIIPLNPVDTARSRAAWVSSLEQLGGTAPAGWEGDHPTATAEGRRQGGLLRSDEADLTEAAAVNQVQYVSLLEYGTQRRAPAAMVRRGLLKIMPTIAGWFRLGR
ncbi:hypothetical protein [Planctomicrobium sp. SH664]|uniref:hypothetical protein n=1 Tax=Planctomicrobium sp. SH664 TaxID=3448125 RepID=UPI003F5BA099